MSSRNQRYENSRARRPRAVIVIKYYHPLSRISGIIGLLTPLTKYLARRYDVHVVTYRQTPPLEKVVHREGYTIHRVSPSFPVAAAIKVRALAPSIVLLVSGIHSYPLDQSSAQPSDDTVRSDQEATH